MTDRLVVDLGADGAVRVGAVPDGELPSFQEAASLAWPLDDEALEDLRWYLEDYLIAPYGVYEDRGARIAGELDGWGRTVFKAVFGTGPARDAYVRMRTRGEVELVFRSDAPSLLGLPWELMADPARDTPLALDIAGVSRALPVAPDAAETVPVPGGRLRVLMVISRPAGTGDVGYRIVARPLLERLEAVRGQVDLVVLRPPTLNALRAELKRAADDGAPYQVVHFDGHGAFLGLKTSDLGEGVLVFEHPNGGPQHVPAQSIARLLADAKVPVIVLNACQSGAVGKALEAAVATRLLREGVASVVAMAYSVYAVAAAEFMAAFYERLFAGGTVSWAVTEGRRQLFRTPGRPSPKGDLPLADWLIPVLYARREVSFPQAVVRRSVESPSLEDALAKLKEEAGRGGTGDLDAVDGVFIGRDALFYDLEAAARLQKVVVLVGPGGTGKTELAKAFGRWWRDTGGLERPEWVFWHSFEPGVASFGLGGVISEIGLALYGTQFALKDADDRRDLVRRALVEHRMLLIWDNFESLREMPDPGRATPPLDEAGCAEIRDFLAGLAHGKSAALITSRTTEDWLGPVRRLKVGGLTKSEAFKYADILLAPYPAARDRRGRRAFADLMTWLDGHPLTMRLTLPRLADAGAELLLASLRGAEPLEGDHEEQGRTRSLAASIAHSYAHLSEQTRRLLPAVSLFHGVADVGVLATFSAVAHVPERFAGATVEHWDAVLADAARVGLLNGLSRDIYQVHPALPGYLIAAWQGEEPGAQDAARRALLTAHASLGEWLSDQIRSVNAGFAYAMIRLERHTMGSLLGYALAHSLWHEALAIAHPLNQYWDARGLDEETEAWIDRVLAATEAPDGTRPRVDAPAGDLWLFFAGVQAERDLKRGHLVQSERCYMEMLDALQGMAASADGKRYIATTYHQLGRVTEEGRRLGEAEEWYRKSLALEEETGNRAGLATTYHQLGVVAERRDRLGEAEEWYRKSLAIKEEAGDRPGLATTYHQLGTVAFLRGQLDAAQEWHRKSLAILEGAADRPGMATIYHQLGVVAQERGRLGEAEAWYRKSLVTREETGDRPGMAITYGQLGVLAEKRGALPEALAWMIACVALFDEFPHPATEPGPENLALLARRLGIAVLGTAWREVTGNELPEGVRDYVQRQLQEGQ